MGLNDQAPCCSQMAAIDHWIPFLPFQRHHNRDLIEHVLDQMVADHPGWSAIPGSELTYSMKVVDWLENKVGWAPAIHHGQPTDRECPVHTAGSIYKKAGD